MDELLRWSIIPRCGYVSLRRRDYSYLGGSLKDDCRAVDEAMTECSRWIRGHDQSAANGTPFPPPVDLQKRIQDLDEWVKGIRKRRK
jgi:hypothetical protein